VKEYFYWRDNTLYIQVWLQPSAKQNRIVGPHGESLKIQITAAPIDGKANKELCDFLATHFAVPKNNVTVLRGKSSRQKLVSIKQPKKNLL